MLDTALAGTHGSTGWSPGKSKEEDHRTWGNCHKAEEHRSVQCDLKLRSVAGKPSQMVCKVQGVRSVVNGSIVSIMSLIIYKDLGWLMKTQLFTVNSES